MKIDLGVPKLFDSLLEIDVDGYSIDLHNDYTCFGIKYEKSRNKVILAFIADSLEERADSDYKQIELLFEEAEISELNLSMNIETTGLCLDNFYRGRIEHGKGLIDKTVDGKCLFYLDFCEGQSLEILAAKVSIDR